MCTINLKEGCCNINHCITLSLLFSSGCTIELCCFQIDAQVNCFSLRTMCAYSFELEAFNSAKL